MLIKKTNSLGLISNLIIKDILFSPIHTSAYLKANSPLSKNIIEDETKYLKENLEEFKTKVSEIREEEWLEELDNSKDILKKVDNEITSFDEAFPNYIKEIIKSNISEDNNNGDANSVFLITKQFGEVIKEFKEAGYSEEILKKIKISDVISKVDKKLNNSEETKDEVAKIVKDQWKEILDNSGIMDMTIREIMLKFNENNKLELLMKKLNEKVAWDLNSYQIGMRVVSYGLLIKSYNKLVYNRPYPSHFTPEQLRSASKFRYYSRIWFAGVFAPMLLMVSYGFQKEILNVTIGQSTIFPLFIMKIKNYPKFWSFIGLLLLTLFVFIGLGWIDYKNILYFFSYYYYNILYFVILFPIVINILVLLLFVLIIRVNKISQILSSNKYSAFLVEICKNKGLLNYYRKSAYIDLIIYGFFLAIVIIFY